jgi:hypothetical protein
MFGGSLFTGVIVLMVDVRWLGGVGAGRSWCCLRCGFLLGAYRAVQVSCWGVALCGFVVELCCGDHQLCRIMRVSCRCRVMRVRCGLRCGGLQWYRVMLVRWWCRIMRVHW